MKVDQENDRPLSAAFAIPSDRLRHTPRLPLEHAAVKRGTDLRHRLNMLLTIMVVVLLVLSPIPVGGNRPPLWLAWGIYVGIVTVAYAVTLLRLGATPRVPISEILPEFVLWLVLVGFNCLQLVPLGNVLPLGEIHTPYAVFPLERLSLDPGQSTMVLIQFATYGLLYFLILQIAVNRRRARRLLHGLFYLIVGFAITGLASLTVLGDTLLGFEKVSYQGFATGTFINRNSFATYLAIGLVLGVAILLQTVAEREERSLEGFVGRGGLVGVGLAIIGATLLATGSRMGALSAMVGIAATLGLGLYAYRAAIHRPLVLIIAATVCLLIGIVATYFGESLLHRLIFVSLQEEQRADLYPIIWSTIMQRPFLGYGAGSFAVAFQAFQAPPMAAEAYFVHSHSTYLALWFEFGLVVGSVPMAILAIVTVKVLRSVADSSSVLTSLATIGAVTVFAVHSTLDFSAEMQANGFLLTAVLALGAAGAGPVLRNSFSPVETRDLRT